MIMYKIVGIALISLLPLASCIKNNENVEVLARVGSSVLTKDVVINRFPDYRTSDVENQVGQWVNAELLYAAGVRAGLDRDIGVLDRVKDYQKKLIGQTYLEMELGSRTGVSNEEIKNYYTAEKEMFKRLHGEALVNSFNVDNKRDANNIRTLLEKGAGNKKRDEMFEKYDVSVISVKEDQLLPRLNKAIFGSKISKYVGPIKLGDKYAVIEIIKRFSKGSYRSLDDVYDHIYLVIQKRKAAIQSAVIIDSLKQEYLFELNIGGM